MVGVNQAIRMGPGCAEQDGEVFFHLSCSAHCSVGLWVVAVVTASSSHFRLPSLASDLALTSRGWPRCLEKEGEARLNWAQPRELNVDANHNEGSGG